MNYRLIDSGNCRKLEQVGEYRLVRPALNAFWEPSLGNDEWKKADGVFTRNSSGGGSWKWYRKMPESWLVKWGNFELKVKATNFGHLGFFAEQYRNWDFFREFIPQIGDKGKVTALNMFAYSGVGSMAMAEAGALVTHLDAARGMNDWGRENQVHNTKVPDSIRWICDDVKKFVAREIRRGNKYNCIALDPPTFGRGSKGQVWKIEDDLPKLLESCNQLRDKSNDFVITLSCHSPGYSPIVLERMLTGIFGEGETVSGEMTIPEQGGRLLPAGISARLILKRVF